MNQATAPNVLAALDLKEGEKLAFSVTLPDGNTIHTILLPGDHEDDTWQTSMEWAQSIGGDLPDRAEQALLFAHLKDRFKERAYWSNTPHAADSPCAWSQVFRTGHQSLSTKSAELRARAVRRVVLEGPQSSSE